MKIYYLLCVLFILFISCSSGNSDSSPNGSENNLSFQLDLIHKWSFVDNELIPNPRFINVLEDTSLVIVDGFLNTINHFSKKGDLLSTAGRSGRGPMEFQFLGPKTVSISSSGNVALYDMNNARLTIYNIYSEEYVLEDLKTGWNTQIQWVGNRILITSSPFDIEPQGSLSMSYFDLDSMKFMDLYKLELKSNPDSFSDQISCTFCFIHFDTDLNFYSSVPDTSYRVTKVNPYTGSSQVFSRPNAPIVHYSMEERQRREERSLELTGRKVDVPEYNRRVFNYFTNDDNQLWVLLNVPEGERRIMDVFEPNGKHLGSVAYPEKGTHLKNMNPNWLVFEQRNSNRDFIEADSLNIQLYEIDSR